MAVIAVGPYARFRCSLHHSISRLYAPHDRVERDDARGGPAAIIDGPIKALTADAPSTIMSGEPVWQRLVPLVRLLARQAAAETARNA